MAVPSSDAPAAIRALRAALDALAGVPAQEWDGLPAEWQPAAATLLAQVGVVRDSAEVAVAGALAASEAAETYGWADAKDFLTALSGGRKGAGSGLVWLADRLRHLPATRAAMAEGWLSKEKAKVIVTQTTRLPNAPELRAAAEQALLARARDLDATDLGKAFPAVVREIDPDGRLLGSDLGLPQQERAAHRERFLSFAPNDFGGVHIRGYATVEDVELVKATLLPLTAPRPTEPGACGGVPRTPENIAGLSRDESRALPHCPDPDCFHDGRDLRDFGARLWDALVEACGRLQSAEVLPDSHRASPRLLVTVSLDELRAATSTGAGGTTLDGMALSAMALRRLACDSEVIPAVLGSQSQILDVGRASRLVTAALWLALVLRDQHCAFPGCRRRPEACEAHHIVHWAEGGTTALANLILLCRHHHTVVHRTPWTVAIDPETGRPVWTPPPHEDDSGRCTYYPARPAA